jgi:phosphoribosylaminoimidazole carboxylase PurE protein
MPNPLVSIVMGSESDRELMEGTSRVLDELEIPYEMIVSSAHRTPEKTREYAQSVEKRGIRVVIAGAGGAAHLAGALASETLVPVIGVPLPTSPLTGWDALLSTVQMPAGIPVATMAVGRAGARNAALFAAQILALEDTALAQRLAAYRNQWRT